MRTAGKIYQPSGNLGSGIFLGPLFGLFTGVVGSLIYAYVDIYSPVVGVVSLLGVLGLGWVVGWAVGKGAHLGHLRNPFAVYASGFLVGVVTLYFAWVFFEWVLIRKAGEVVGVEGVIGLLISPLAVWDLARQIGEVGWYSIGSSGAEVSGVALWITWICEAVLLIGMVTKVSGSWIDDAVYCEHRKSWLPIWPEPVHLRFPEEPEKLERLAEAELEHLEAFEAAGGDEVPRIDVQVWAAEQSPRTAAFRAQLLIPKLDKEGNLQIETNHLSPKILASASDVERLAALASRAPAPLPEPAEEELGEAESMPDGIATSSE